MGARQKLNAAYLQSGLLAATIIGFLAQSWVAFAVTSAVLLGLALHGGEIRPHRRGR